MQLANNPEDTCPALEDTGFANLLSDIRGLENSDEKGDKDSYKEYLAKEKIVCLHLKHVLEEIGDSKDSCGSRELKVHRSSSLLGVQP